MWSALCKVAQQTAPRPFAPLAYQSAVQKLSGSDQGIFWDFLEPVGHEERGGIHSPGNFFAGSPGGRARCGNAGPRGHGAPDRGQHSRAGRALDARRRVKSSTVRWSNTPVRRSRSSGNGGRTTPFILRICLTSSTSSHAPSRSGSPYEILQRFRRSDGVYRWFQNSGFPVRDPAATSFAGACC